MSNVYNKSRLNTPFPLTPLRDRLLMTNQTLWRSPMTTHFMHHSDAEIAPPPTVGRTGRTAGHVGEAVAIQHCAASCLNRPRERHYAFVCDT